MKVVMNPYYVIIILIPEVPIDLIRVIFVVLDLTVVVHDYTNILIDVKIHWDLMESHQSVLFVILYFIGPVIIPTIMKQEMVVLQTVRQLKILMTLDSFFLLLILANLTSY